MKKQLLFSIAIFSFAVATLAQTSTGFMCPTSTTAPNGWTNPANAYVSDDVYTTVAHQSGCRCPFLYLSWNNGVNYTSSQLVGPFGTSDATQVAGSPTTMWGHAWVQSEFSNANFEFKIANPSTVIEQGYNNFNFNIPMGATINGIEVKVEEHGDSAFTMEFIDLIQVNVYYTVLSSVVMNFDPNSVSVFPNPATTSFEVDHPGINLKGIYLIDMLGRKVLEVSDFTNEKTSVNVEGLAKGIYDVEIVSENGEVINKKILVE
jgi:hypothetical protein